MNSTFGIRATAAWGVIALVMALALLSVAAQSMRGGDGDAGVTHPPRTAQCAALSPDLTGLQGVRAPTAMIAGGGWSNMTQNARLTSSDAGVDGFGASVAISGAAIAVGARSGRGVGYVFVRPGGGWAGDLAQAAILTALSRLFFPLVLRSCAAVII